MKPLNNTRTPCNNCKTAINNRETIWPPSFTPTSSGPLINHWKVTMGTHTIYYFQQNIGDLASTLPFISVNINKAYLQFWLFMIHFSRNRSIQPKYGSCSLDHHFGGFEKPSPNFTQHPIFSQVSILYLLLTFHYRWNRTGKQSPK